MKESSQFITYDQAVVMCEEDSALPASIRSEQENQQILRVVQGSNTFWIGLTRDYLNEGFIWPDKTRALYTNLTSLDTYRASSRFYVSPWNGGWGEAQENDEIPRVLCEFPKRSEEVRFEYETVANLSVKVYNTSMEWNEARARCQSENADLLIINDDDTNEKMCQYAKSKGIVDAFFIGLTGKITDEGIKYEFINGQDMTDVNGSGEEPFNAFALGFPDDHYGTLVTMRTSFFPSKWMNVADDSVFPFICARSLEKDMNDDVSTSCPPVMCTQDFGEFTSPSFPNVACVKRCDFLIKRPIFTTIAIWIEFLEANSCCDNLLIYEGLYGTTPVVNLTGFISPSSIGHKVLVTSSPIIRVVWNAKSGAHVRGFKLRYSRITGSLLTAQGDLFYGRFGLASTTTTTTDVPQLEESNTEGYYQYEQSYDNGQQSYSMQE